MFLIDTSTWIDYFRSEETSASSKLQEILDLGLPFGITGVIYQELLQGAHDQATFDRLEHYLSTQRFYHPADPITTFSSAGHLYFECRRSGVTPRSSVDCLIAQIAIENSLLLVDSDRDFELMAEVVPELRRH